MVRLVLLKLNASVAGAKAGRLLYICYSAGADKSFQNLWEVQCDQSGYTVRQALAVSEFDGRVRIPVTDH